MKKAKVTNTRTADENNVVHRIEGGGSLYRRQPCAECPWRVTNAGSFPAEAFRISAHTAYDAAMESFACHISGKEKPATCAGFLLQNADHNLGVRIRAMKGEYDWRQVSAGDAELFEDYRAMAEANGVGADEAVLARCRGNAE